MLFTFGIIILSLLVIALVVGMAPPQWLLLASVVVSYVCLPGVSGWAIAFSMVAGYVLVGVALMSFEALRDRSYR